MTGILWPMKVRFPALLALAALPAVAADDSPDLVDVFENGPDALESLAAGPLGNAIQLSAQEYWQNFWQNVQQTLHTDSVTEMASFLPQARIAMDYLSGVPESKPYTDWLRQRLDYFDLADDILQRLQPPSPRAPAPPRPAPGVSPRPTPRPPSRVPTPDIALRVARAIRSEQVWQSKLAKRPAPPESGSLVPSLKQVFASEGVPPQWVWLAEVESSMNPRARSPSGALGLFQLMPDTAKRMGLRTSLVDERTNPHKSARAAARYLRFLHGEFGSWPLAIAAYNAGEGCVGRALKQRKAKTFEEVAPALPLETQMYVPKVMAVVSLREGVNPSRLPAPSAPVAALR